MPRPRKCRKVCCLPQTMEFTPVNGSDKKSAVVLTVDEYETIRLIDKQGFSQEECGAYMKIARTTVQQIYTAARRKLADVLVEGLPLKIEGGDYQLCDGKESYCGCGGCHKHRRSNMENEEKQGGHLMKIAIPVAENKTAICPSFGRAPYFLFHETETGNTEILENPAAQAEGGAGLKASQFAVDQGTDVLITIRCGENAAEVLKAAEIRIYKAEGSNAEENLSAFQGGKLSELTHFHAGFHGIR